MKSDCGTIYIVATAILSISCLKSNTEMFTQYTITDVIVRLQSRQLTCALLNVLEV